MSPTVRERLVAASCRQSCLSDRLFNLTVRSAIERARPGRLDPGTRFVCRADLAVFRHRPGGRIHPSREHSSPQTPLQLLESLLRQQWAGHGGIEPLRGKANVERLALGLVVVDGGVERR